jgi:Leucine-rich repeat (LRR) protein
MTELAVQLRHAKRNQATTLDLSKRMLTFLPKEVFLIPTLAHLNLSYNQIEHLPP